MAAAIPLMAAAGSTAAGTAAAGTAAAGAGAACAGLGAGAAGAGLGSALVPGALTAASASPWLASAPAFAGAGEGLAGLSGMAASSPWLATTGMAQPAGAGLLGGLVDKVGPALEKGSKIQSAMNVLSPQKQGDRQVSMPYQGQQAQQMSSLLGDPTQERRARRLRNLGLLG